MVATLTVVTIVFSNNFNSHTLIIFRLLNGTISFKMFPEFDSCRHESNILHHIAPVKKITSNIAELRTNS